ncbi:hypothetical protein P3X46_029232 [Hevea brasiliensis]|uniref:rRNA adenine N(6)-methyltransferase n=1 Tax=Hevea brasiliensis TaxID=3981 RepID=A0ABQ9KST1_HEVBR|nr:ribosomal RNA small subunit methyltransferase, mitochondrial-like isoform X1 [Hevea brasiliensis]KAJ9147027.1 hypothetical protein P3X46_029232 [Hevea brasiliensis]
MNVPLKNQLLSIPKSIQFYLIQSIFHLNSLRELPTTTVHPRARRRNSEDGKKIRNAENDMEGNLYLYKSKGQHLLTNPRVLDTIVRISQIKSTDTVLEIGPGTGNLTIRLLEVAKKVVAVEIDKRMVEILCKRVSEHGLHEKLDILCGDALKAKFPQFDLVVANIPCGISSPLVTKLVYGAKPFRSLTLLLQKEFARRLLANPRDSEYNRLAVNVKLAAKVEFVMDVRKRDFLPCPKVDSSVVIIRPKAEIPSVNLDEWWAFTRTCFSNKNKTLAAIFKQKKKVMELIRLSKMRGFHGEYGITSRYYDFAAADEEEEEEEEEEETSHEQSCHPCFGSEKDLSSYKERINKVLKANGFEGKRPSKLPNEELLNLLSLLNQAGIYFHGRTRPGMLKMKGN